jgi:disulfide oxidoreductase YuzD
MIFFLKRSTIHVDCFTSRKDVYEYSPIVEASKCIPDWWKKLPKPGIDENLVAHTNMRNCVGFIDFHTNALCMRLWSELAIKLNYFEKKFNFQFSDFSSDMEFHPKQQFERFLSDDYAQFKIISPWIFKTKEDVNWIVVQNIYSPNLSNDLCILPGVLNFKYQPSTHIQCVIKGGEGVILRKKFDFNMPLMNLFPLTDKKIKFKNHLISDGEYSNKMKLTNNITFFKKYRMIKNLVDSKEKESKCPFGFK